MEILGTHSEKANVGVFRTLDEGKQTRKKSKVIVRVGLCCHGRMFGPNEDAAKFSIFETCFARLDHASGMDQKNIFTLQVLPICVPFWDFEGMNSERVLDTKTYARDLHSVLLQVSLSILRWRYQVCCVVAIGKPASTILTNKFTYDFHRMETKKKSSKHVDMSLKQYLQNASIPVRVLPHTTHVKCGLFRCSKDHARRLRSQFDLLLSNTAKFELDSIGQTSRTSAQIFSKLHSDTSISQFSLTHTKCVTCNFMRTRMFGNTEEKSLMYETCVDERYSADQWFEALNTTTTRNGGMKKQYRKRLAKNGPALRRILSEHASVVKVYDNGVDSSSLYRVRPRTNVRVTIILVCLIF